MSDDLNANLLDAAYEGIVFPVSEAPDTATVNSYVAHKAYRRPGADVEPTGREPYEGTLVIPLFNDIQGYGVLFPDLLERLRQKIIATPIGSLTHPRLGVFQAHIGKLSEPLRSDQRNGLVATLEYLEHNASVSDAIVFQGQTGQDTSVTANQQAVAADTAMAAAVAGSGATFTPTAPVVAAQTASLESASQPIGAVQASIAAMTNVVQGNLALPSLQTVAAYPALVALETLQATVYQLQAKFLGANAHPATYTVPVTMPLWEIAYQVYQDASQTDLLASANPIDDWTAVPAGRQLIVPAPPS